MSKKKAAIQAALKAKMDAKAEKVRAYQAKGALGAFASLDDDVAARLYRVGTRAADIDVSGLKRDFSNYSGGTSIDDAVEEAIAALSCNGSTRAQYSRHDFQDTSGDVNLQVQLGGSRPYRVGKGDTSATMVLVDAELFEELKARGSAHLEDVLRAAHRQSYANGQGVEIRRR